MRSVDQLEKQELMQYCSLMERKADQTLSAADHEAIQEQIDKLLWKDADGRLNTIEERLDAIETAMGLKGAVPGVLAGPDKYHAGHTTAPPAAPTAPVTPPAAPAPITHGEAQKAVGDEIRQRVSQSIGLKDSVVAKVEISPGVEGFYVVNGGVDKWLVKHPDPKMEVVCPVPFSTCEEASRIATTLNAANGVAPLTPATPQPLPSPHGVAASLANPLPKAPPEVVATAPTEVHARPAATQSEDGRGRPTNRFKVGGKRGNWFVEDSTGAIPAEAFPSWKLKKDCANSAKGLNGHPNPDSLFAGAAAAAAPVPSQPQAAPPVDENAAITNWDPDPIPVTPQQAAGLQAAQQNAEPVGRTEATAAVHQPPAVIPATGHTNAPVAGGGVIAPGGDMDALEGVVIHKPSDADAGIHLMANEQGQVVRVDPMGLGDID